MKRNEGKQNIQNIHALNQLDEWSMDCMRTLHFHSCKLNWLVSSLRYLLTYGFCISAILSCNFHFILGVLLDNLKGSNDASRFALASPIITVSGALFSSTVYSSSCLCLNQFQRNFVVLVELCERNKRLLNQGNCIGTIFQCFLKGNRSSLSLDSIWKCWHRKTANEQATSMTESITTSTNC